MRKHHDQGKFEEGTANFGLWHQKGKSHHGKVEACWLEQRVESSHLQMGSMRQRGKDGNGFILRKLSPSDILPLSNPHLLKLPKQHHELVTQWSNTWICRDHFHSNHDSPLSPTFVPYSPEILSALTHHGFKENLQAVGRLLLRQSATSRWLRATEDMMLEAVQCRKDRGSVEKTEADIIAQ